MGAQLVYYETKQRYVNERTLEERTTEVYHLGQLTKEVPDWLARASRNPNPEATKIARGPFYVTYTKFAGRGCMQECVEFGNKPQGKDAHLFFRSSVYGNCIQKRTDRNGRIRRVSNDVSRNKKHSIEKRDEDIVARLQSLPPQVLDVYGLGVIFRTEILK